MRMMGPPHNESIPERVLPAFMLEANWYHLALVTLAEPPATPAPGDQPTQRRLIRLRGPVPVRRLQHLMQLPEDPFPALLLGDQLLDDPLAEDLTDLQRTNQ